jgi:sulfane dehydrogenase subunit SoxC
VPSWYGMASVKWLRAITVLNGPFLGLEQSKAYRYKQSDDDPGTPVREKKVNSVMKPPGIPDLLSRYRFLSPGPTTIQGMAWSGSGPIVSVDVSIDDGVTWTAAHLAPAFPNYSAWTPWSVQLTIPEGTHFLRCRATDSAGNQQPLNPNDTWNYEGHGVNAVERLPLVVQQGVGMAGNTVPSTPQVDVPGAMLPPRPDEDDNNQVA